MGVSPHMPTHLHTEAGTVCSLSLFCNRVWLDETPTLHYTTLHLHFYMMLTFILVKYSPAPPQGLKGPGIPNR